MDVGGDERPDAAVDANDFAAHVEEGSAGIAADQGAVGAHEVLVAEEHAAEADDRSAARLDAARMSDRQAPVAVLQDAGVAHVDVGELGFLRDLHEPAVDAAVAAESERNTASEALELMRNERRVGADDNDDRATVQIAE